MNCRAWLTVCTLRVHMHQKKVCQRVRNQHAIQCMCLLTHRRHAA